MRFFKPAPTRRASVDAARAADEAERAAAPRKAKVTIVESGPLETRDEKRIRLARAAARAARK